MQNKPCGSKDKTQQSVYSFQSFYCTDFITFRDTRQNWRVLNSCCEASQYCRVTQEHGCLLVHGPAVCFVLVGGNHLVHIDSNRGQDAVQLLHCLLGQGGLSAQDPGQLHAEQAEVCAAVDQRVALIVSGQHPVGTWGRCCSRDQYESHSCWNIQHR